MKLFAIHEGSGKWDKNGGNLEFIRPGLPGMVAGKVQDARICSDKVVGMLAGNRVLDLTDEKGLLCGKILGDLGADVIKIERPGGDSARNIGPFYNDIPDPQKSLFWFSYNTSKRGITLNIETEDGKEIFKRIVKTADFIVESFSPGYLDNLGLGYSALTEINSRIIMASISPFGQEGPYRNYKASNLVLEAMSGMLYIKGDPDRPPLCFSLNQTYSLAGVQAAAGMLISDYYRQQSGHGQHVDISMQAAAMASLLNVNAIWWMNRVISKRQGIYEKVGQSDGGWLKRPVLFRCKDGYVSYLLVGAQLWQRQAALVEWMDSEGMAGQLKDVDWSKIDFREVAQEEHDAWLATVEKFFLVHTKAELYREAAKRGLFVYPLSTVKDLFDNEQLKERAFWERVEHLEIGTYITYPGAPFKSTEKSWRICRAPLIGEHNLDIFEKELGFSRLELCALKQRGVI